MHIHSVAPARRRLIFRRHKPKLLPVLEVAVPMPKAAVKPSLREDVASCEVLHRTRMREAMQLVLLPCSCVAGACALAS